MRALSKSFQVRWVFSAKGVVSQHKGEFLVKGVGFEQRVEFKKGMHS